MPGSWAGSRHNDLRICTCSVVTLSEIERGILRQRRINPQFAEALASWMDRILQTYSDRLLPVGVAEARRWAS